MRPEGIPYTEICFHLSTLDPSTKFLITDTGMVGFDGRFSVRCYIAGWEISREPFNDETAAREFFEKAVERHYD